MSGYFCRTMAVFTGYGPGFHRLAAIDNPAHTCPHKWWAIA
jgi:hypothetical protein